MQCLILSRSSTLLLVPIANVYAMFMNCIVTLIFDAMFNTKVMSGAKEEEEDLEVASMEAEDEVEAFVCLFVICTVLFVMRHLSIVNNL